MSRTLYEFQLPALIDDSALRRLRGSLDMCSSMSIRYCDLERRTIRVRTRSGRDLELRALFTALGFPPTPEDPAIERRRRLARPRRWREALRQSAARTPRLTQAQQRMPPPCVAHD